MSAHSGSGGGTGFAPGMTLADMRVETSDDGQYLLIYCRRRIVAMLGPMGGDVEAFEFADVGWMTAAELVGRL